MYTIVIRDKGIEQSRFKLSLVDVEYFLVYTEQGTLTLIQSEKRKEEHRLCALLKIDTNHHLLVIPEDTMKLKGGRSLSTREKCLLYDGDILTFGEKEVEIFEVLEERGLRGNRNLTNGVGASSDVSPLFSTQSYSKKGMHSSTGKGGSYSSVKDTSVNNDDYVNKLALPLPVLDSSSLTSTGNSNQDKEHLLKRQATVRYFNRMYPFYTYPVRVFLSEGKVQEIQVNGVSQAQNATPLSMDAKNPIVTLVPVFPGAIVVPEQICLDVSPEKVQAEFWVTPQTEGSIEQARVEIHHQGRILDRVLTPYRVTKHTFAKISLVCSLLFPLVSPLLNYYQISILTPIEHGFSAFKQLYWLFEKTPPLAGFSLFFILASLLYWWKRPKEANPITQFLSLEPVFEPSKEPTLTNSPFQEGAIGTKSEADRIYDQARKCFDEGKNAEAMIYFEKALPIYRSIRICDEYGLLLCDMGRTLLSMDEYERALNIYAEEQSVWIRLGLELDRGRCLSNIGITHRLRKDYAKAEVFLKEAIEIRKQSFDLPGQRRSQKELGAVYELQAKWERARSVYQELASLYKEEGNQDEYAHMLNLLGIVAYKTADDENAIKFYTESLHINESLGLELPKADNLYNLGLVYKQKRNKESALQYFREAHEIYLAQGDMDWARSAENSIRDLEKL